MAISVDWPSRVITVPQADLTPVGPSQFELDVDSFRRELRSLEDDVEGMPFPKTHTHTTEVTIGGTVFARLVQIINNYTLTFEDGQYSVSLIGANSNLADVINVNQVSVRSNNSAGLISGGVNQETLQRVLDLLESDEKLTPTGVQRRHRTTKELLLEKTVTGAPESTPEEINLIE